MSLARSCFVVPSIPSPLTPPSHFSGHGGISLTGIITRVKILCLVPVQGGSVRQVFAFVVLVACIRLWLAFHTVPIGLSVSEAHGHDINRNVKGIETVARCGGRDYEWPAWSASGFKARDGNISIGSPLKGAAGQGFHRSLNSSSIQISGRFF